VLRENMVRLDGLPLTLRAASLPALDPGARVRIELSKIDLLERSVACTYRETLGHAAVMEDAAKDG
jgi:exoribonuclease-2